MKKKILALFLAFMLVISLAGCRGDDGTDPDTGLSASEQVRIAKETYQNIHNAIKNEHSVQPISVAGFNSSIDDLLEEKGVESSESSRIVNSVYYLNSQPISVLLNKLNEETLYYEYMVEMDLANNEDDPDTIDSFYGLPWPEIVSFQGVISDNSHNVVYTTMTSLPCAAFNGAVFNQICTSYYESDLDYMYEYVYVNYDYTSEFVFGMYGFYDRNSNHMLWMMITNESYQIFQFKNGVNAEIYPCEFGDDRFCIEDYNMMHQYIVDSYEMKKHKSLELVSNNNIIKMVYTLNIITIEFDFLDCYDMI